MGLAAHLYQHAEAASHTQRRPTSISIKIRLFLNHFHSSLTEMSYRDQMIFGELNLSYEFIRHRMRVRAIIAQTELT